MQKENIVIGIHSQPELPSDTEGLKNGFANLGLKTYTIDECFEKDIIPNLAIGFDDAGLTQWQKLLNKGITSIMLSSDSVFNKNYELVKQFSAFRNFVFLHSTTADNEPLGKFLPNIIHGYLPWAVDTEFWCETNTEKDIDIAIVGSIIDAGKTINNLKSTMPELVFKLMSEVINIALINPVLSISDICKAIEKQMELDFTDEQIILFMTQLSEIITTRLYEKAVAKLRHIDGIKITLVGDTNWEKYQGERVSIVNISDETQKREILQRSKLVMTIPPYSATGGIDATILQAVSCGAVVLTPFTPLLKNEMGDTLCYFNPTTCEDIEEKAKLYLENNQARNDLKSSAQKIVNERNTWNNRAKAIFDILDIK